MDKWRDRLVRKGNYVYGSFLKPSQVDGYINGINPGDRSDSLGRYPFSESGVDDAVTCAAEGAAAWRRVGLNERAQAVRRFRDALHRELERAAGLVTRENGKPFWEARQEILNTIHALDLFLDDGMSLLAPTVLELVGCPPLPGVQGRSLVGAMRGDQALDPERPVFAETRGYGSTVRSVRQGDWKLILTLAEGATEPGVELFDLASDPGETRNLATAEPRRVARLTRLVREWAGENAWLQALGGAP